MTDTPDLRRKLPIDRPCSACSAGDYDMQHHDHAPPFSEPALPELLEKARVHWAMIGDESAGMCWDGDCYPGEPQKVSTDIREVTCAECRKHYTTMDDLKRAQVGGGAQPEPDWPDCRDFYELMQKYRHWPIEDIEGVAVAYKNIIEYVRAGSSPAPTDSIRCMECKASVCDHIANTLLELNMVDAPRGSSPAPQYIGFDPARGEPFTKYWCTFCGISDQPCTHWVTGNEGKDAPIGPDNTDALAKSPLNPAPLASPAVVTPEQDELFARGWLNAKDQKLLCVSRLLDSNADSADIEECMNRFARAYATDLRAKVSELEAQLQQAQSSRIHTQDWYARHYGKLHDWARTRLPAEWRDEFFCCIANGTWGFGDVGKPYMSQAGEIVPSNYFRLDSAAEQILHDQSTRAETAEAELERMRAGGKS